MVADATDATHPARAGHEGHAPVRHVVLTGGPGAGKTTALAFLVDRLARSGWKVLTAPEAATLLVNSGLGDLGEIAAGNPAAFETVQDTIVATQLAFRDAYDTLARSFAATGTPTVVLHDRGVADNGAYIDAGTYARVLDRAGHTPATALDRYDAVLHLRSAAVATDTYDAAAYTRENNVARTEDADAAAALDAATLASWSDHPHLFVIAADGDFTAKLDRVLAAALTVLGDPEPVENERKFLLLDAPDLTHPLLAGARLSRIEQTYLATTDGEQRVRARTTEGHTSYAHTTKVDLGPESRIERETHIEADTYRLLRTLAAPGTCEVVKNRRVFFSGDHRFELDEFLHPPVGWVCEVELIDPADPVTVPDCLGAVHEVTDDPQWRNRHLATLH